jgi:hypothetical protein
MVSKFAFKCNLYRYIEATSIVYDGKNISWDDQCYKIGPACSISHPLEAFAAPADYDSTVGGCAQVEAS